MTNRSKILSLLSAYVFITAVLTIYHAFNFSKYIHWKGEETMDYTYFLLLTSVGFQAIVWIIIKKIDWKAALLSTVVNFILSFVIGFGILMTSGISGIPRHLIFIYGGCYLTFFTIVTILQSNRLKESNMP